MYHSLVGNDSIFLSVTKNSGATYHHWLLGLRDIVLSHLTDEQTEVWMPLLLARGHTESQNPRSF